MLAAVPPSDDQLRELEILIRAHHPLLLVDTVTLVNLVAETRVVPEFLLEKCTTEQIVPAIMHLLEDDAAADEQRVASERVMQLLGRGGEAPGLRAARSVLTVLDR